MDRSAAFFDSLARAILAGDSVDERLRPFADRFRAAVAPRYRDLVRRLRADADLQQLLSEHREKLTIPRQLLAPIRMSAARWNVAAIHTPGDLADWLALTPGELDWFADLKGLAVRGKLQHYRYRVIDKGGGAVRIIESPKQRLKWIQQRILAGIPDKIPPHAAAHGFVKGRSVRSFAAPHVGQRVVLRMDLRDFFPSIGGARVQTVFRTMGYHETVADLLGGIATNEIPREVWRDPLYNRPHLPQGAPTSPAIANLCLYRADCRLLGLAERARAQYTRYADDLAFSGGEDFERCVERFSTHVAAILYEEGFAVHHRKTRIMRQGVRQHLAGVVTNAKLNVRRADFDRLKAILTNCSRQGGRSDLRAHLDGRVSWVESINPARGSKLRAIFGRIIWE